MKTIRYRGGYKYQLAEEYRIHVVINAQRAEAGDQTSATGSPGAGIVTEFIELDPDGRLAIRAGYAWDGPSGPTVDTTSFMRGSLVHDALYQLMRHGHLPACCRKDADQELHRLCREDGMNRFRAWYVLLGARKGAGFAASPRNCKAILSAP